MAKNDNEVESTDLDDDVEVDTDSDGQIDKATVQGWVREILAEALPTMSDDDDDEVEASEPVKALTIKDVEEATRRVVADAMKPLRATAKKAAPKKAAPVKEPEDVPVEPGRKTWTERLWGASE